MTHLAAHGIGIRLPTGWHGEIYVRDPGSNPDDGVSVAKPVLHAANFSLPAERGDFGSTAVEVMGRRAVLLAVLEYDDASVGTPLFSHRFPKRLTAREFGPEYLQRPLRGQAGAQRFVTEGGRAFCVYAVLGSYALRKVLVPELNNALSQVIVTPAA